MPNYFSIQEFYGIQQHKDGALLPPGTAYDARNVDTSDGNLRLAKGFEKFNSMAAVPGSEGIYKLIIARTSSGRKWYCVTSGRVYVYSGSAWSQIANSTFSPALTASKSVDCLQTKIGADDYLILATGTQQMMKIKISNDSASAFGSGSTGYSGTVSSYNSSTRKVTLASSLDTESARRALAYGVTIAGTLHQVSAASGTSITLKNVPATNPAANDAVSVRGGGSNASCAFVGLYYSRLIAAGDPSNPSRLYWSAISGDGRTVEDWLSVDGSVDASGGYVEIGNTSGDKITGMCVLSTQVLIFKEHSVWRMYGDRPSQFTVERVEEFGEAVANSSIVIKYDVPQFLTKTGIKYYDGTGVLPINRGERVLDRFVQTIKSVKKSIGFHNDNFLYFTCTCGTSTSVLYTDTIVVYDIGRQSFMIRDGFRIYDMIADDGQIFLINGDRYVYEFNKGYTYAGANINAYWNTQPTDLLAKYYKKQIKELMFRGTAGRINFTVRDGSNKTFPKRTLFQDNDGYNSISVSTNKARVFEIRIENEEGSYFEILGGLDISYDRELSQK